MQDLSASLFQSDSLSSPHQQALFFAELQAKSREESVITRLSATEVELCPKACKQITVREQMKVDEDLNIPHRNMRLLWGLIYNMDVTGLVFLEILTPLKVLG